MPPWYVVELGNQRYMAIGSITALPPQLLVAIRHRAEPKPAPAGKKAGALPLRMRDPGSASAVVTGCKARLFRYASLFVLDCSTLLDHVAARCPHSDAPTVLDEVGSAVLGIIGDFGVCLRLDPARLLCGFFSHTEADPELIATQMLLTLRKATCAAEIMTIQAGNFKLLDASRDQAESDCASFIDGL